MSILLVFLVSFIFSNEMFAREVKPLYKLPDEVIVAKDSISETKLYLAASDKGLFKISSTNQAVPLWTDGSVEQIVRVELPNENNKFQEAWYFRTNEGILFSADLETFEFRNNGLPFLTLKDYDGQNVSFHKQVQTLKDLCANPMNPLQLVTATKDNVYISKDGGISWESLGSMSRSTSGIKAVAIASMPKTMSDGTLGSELVVFMSHPIFGLSYIKVDDANPVWSDVSSGFEIMPTMSQTDEIADILPVMHLNKNGSFSAEIYMSQTYIPRIYRFNWETKKGECIFISEEPAETFDGLTMVGNNLLFTKIEGVGAVDLGTLTSPGIPEKFEEWKKSLSSVPGVVNSAWIPYNKTGFKKGVCLNELWLLYPGTINSRYASKANGVNGIKCIYASAYQCRLQSGIDKFKKIINDNNLNGVVIDMKDDYGLLRYDTHDELVKSKGKVTQYAINLDHFIKEFKADNIYLIARIVAFKDRNLASYAGSKYAVWNYRTNSPWVGIKGYNDIIDPETGEVTGKEAQYYDENWIDPYCPEVWEYNVAIAKELIARGFDEIQFDYIRFPTDGYNLGAASYRWKSEGMDKESALVSFLRYARNNIDAPIGIDIYGANGWYRSGTRTGQDAEMLCEYVDVICPMFYPSHFEQEFLTYEPYADRPYRVYYYGTYRNTIMVRNRAIIRPWVQAFYLNVRYDRQYYNKEYVQKEVFGVRDSVNRGYMHWNNSGDYGTISPDVGDSTPYIGTAPEADLKFRKPALGTAKVPVYVDDGISIMDMVYFNAEDEQITVDSTYLPFLNVFSH
ncbi:MAG: hypothetical protein HDR34_10740 [Treponema sp.]|nr:hypothetical protein [Treponema sp.]